MYGEEYMAWLESLPPKGFNRKVRKLTESISERLSHYHDSIAAKVIANLNAKYGDDTATVFDGTTSQ